MATISISRWTDWADIISAAKIAGGNAEKHCFWIGIDETNDQNAILSFNDSALDANVFTQAFANQDVMAIKKAADVKNIQAMRQVEYPNVAEYLDGIVKGDQAQIDKYIADCLAVKAKYPKP